MVTDIFLNQKRVNVCEQMAKMASQQENNVESCLDKQ